MLLECLREVVTDITNFVNTFGYCGIFIMTFIESTFIPLPSEITLIPAGYLIYKKQMSLMLVFITSLSGTLFGSLLNYTIAYKFGRRIFALYGKYFFLQNGQLEYLEQFFDKYGNISTFMGRMLPGVKHFISFPAGLARMNLKLFCSYTVMGSCIWLSILLYFGYFIGDNEKLITEYIKKFNILIIIATIMLAIYLCWYKYWTKGIKK